MKVLLVNYRYFLSGGPESYLFKVEELFRRHGDETAAFSAPEAARQMERFIAAARPDAVYVLAPAGASTSR